LVEREGHTSWVEGKIPGVKKNGQCNRGQNEGARFETSRNAIKGGGNSKQPRTGVNIGDRELTNCGEFRHQKEGEP